ncbi:MAG TPA: transketolase [Gammaproteobacteria bacterium]
MSSIRHPSSPAASDDLCINTLRFLSVDMVEKAASGHPGMPMGAATMAYVLWTRFLKHRPANPQWFDRDRFVLSAGHGSALLYSLLHLSGYPLPLSELKRFRAWESLTPGHPERERTPGVEATTGPLGQGFADGVGMAMAEAHLAARYNRDGLKVIDHYTYGIVSDGDLMEGVASEAASLAGHLKLGKLIYLYDDNRVTLSAGTDITFTEDRAERFAAYGWHTQHIEDGNDAEAIEQALLAAQQEKHRPSLILVRTHIGYGAPDKQDSYQAHGSPLGQEETELAKRNLGWPTEPTFRIPEAVRARYLQSTLRGERAEADWNAHMAAYARVHTELAEELQRRIAGKLPADWDAELPKFPTDAKGMATRVAAGKCMVATAHKLTELMGGSADLDPSTKTGLKDLGDFESPGTPAEDREGSQGGGWSYLGRNLHFGVREHAMGGVLNGLAAHGGFIPYGSTFLIFSDYMRPPMRLASLMKLHVIYVFTHDSIGLGEDGPTHQPVEQLAGLRAVPCLQVIRPADANETAVAWKLCVEAKDHPVALVLTRQDVPTLDRARYASADGARRGAYVLAEAASGKPDVVLVASGSEVSLITAAQEKLRAQGVDARVVSMPCWKIFDAQPEAYRDSVLPPQVRLRLAVEAGAALGWHRYVGDRGDVLSVDRFGASAPGEVVMREYGFTVENVCKRTLALLAKHS